MNSLLGLVDAHNDLFVVSLTIIKTYIKRIEQVNSIIHVISEINREAIDVAREKDEERSRGLAQGSLHGVPILIKNLLFTTDDLKTTCKFKLIEVKHILTS